MSATTETATPATDPVGEDAPPPARDGITDDGHQDDHDDGGDLAKARRQAAGYRTKLRDTEAERDTLTARIAAMEAATVASALATAGLDARLWKAADVDLTEFRSEAGVLDMAALIDRATALRREFGMPDRPRPNPQQGMPSLARPQGLAQAFDPHHARG